MLIPHMTRRRACTKSRTPVGKVEILIFEYFRILRIRTEVFFDADSESPHIAHDAT